MTVQYGVAAPAIWRLSGGERSNAPTPRRRQRARDEGQTWKSPDFQAAAALIVAFAILRWYMPWAGTKLADLEAAVYQNMLIDGFAQGLDSMVPLVLKIVAEVLAPIVLPLAIVGTAVSLAEGGLNFRLSALMPDFNRINPQQALSKMFSMDGVWNLAKGILKILIVGVSAGLMVRQQVAQYPGLMTLSLGAVLEFAKAALTGVLLRAGLAFFLVAIVDVGWQIHSFQQQLRMSHQELRDEQKETEGDPRVKGRRRELQRRYARFGLKAVKKATVVVTNPTHFAVALKWDERTMGAPELVAKGSDEVALRIREMAYRSEVPVVENPPVARALYLLPLGEPIGQEHYQVVAEIIAFILRSRRPRGGR